MLGRPLKEEAIWHQKAAELMVRHSLSLRMAAQHLQVPLTDDEALALFRTRGFQKLLWLERNKFEQELANDPNRSKASAIGLLILALHKMAEQGEWKDVVSGVTALGKLEGWIGSDTQISVLGNLTADEIEQAKKRLQGIVENKIQKPKLEVN